MRSPGLGRYLIEEQLAAGGMGVVYKALDRGTGASIALKRLSVDAAHAAAALHAFQREYQVLKGIAHPRIIRVFDYGVDEVGPYYTMELLGGHDLRDAAPIPWQRAAGYLRDLATSLALLHARKFVHRDISPANVWVTLDGHCKLLDFGALAPFGPSRMIMGTAPMVPPEALRGEPLDPRSDLYALGALAYWMISGRHAYPAKSLSELSRRWQNVPPPLTTLCSEVPADLDQLVMSLLSADARARPSSAAEVISLLTSMAGLLPEKIEDASSLLSSFLTSPRFVGRRDELLRIDSAVGVLSSQGAGSALRFEAMPGMGRSRLLEEAVLRAQLSGATALRLDASVHGHAGALEGLALRLFDLTPDAARDAAATAHGALRALSDRVAARLAQADANVTHEKLELRDQTASIEEWVVAISQRAPLVLAVDNLERADAPTLALLAALARRAPSAPLMLLLAERSTSDEPSLGLAMLRAKCETLRMQGLSPSDTLELARSLFGDEAANVERFAGWLHAQTAGTPLYVLELVRQLVARDLIRLAGGLWVLPQQRPDAVLPERLETALAERLRVLSADARALCGCLALHRLEPSATLCQKLLPEASPAELEGVLDELARADVLVRSGDSYAFTNAALRDAVAHASVEYARLDNHRRLAVALLKLAGPSDARLRLEAGWHFIQGGSDSEGADLIMEVTCDSVAVRHLIGNLYHVGKTVAAALEVYTRQRRSKYERMPLLGALAHAGFYENPVWGDRYGDQALDVLEDISGMATARRLRRVCGRALSLVMGLSIAFGRFLFTPRRQRPYSFKEVITQLLSATTTVTAVAASSLDAERAQRVAEVIEPFSVLPERLTPHGIYEFCMGLQQIARERQADATRVFERLLQRFRDPRYYPTLPADGRVLYSSGLLFAMGAFSVFRASSKVALECANQLDLSGIKIYAMVASQLRYLYYVNRGELEQATRHREQVELHAVQMGSAAQVERWESPALLPIGILIGDVVGTTRAAHRLQMDAGAAYLRPYRRLAEATTLLVSGAFNLAQVSAFLEREVTIREPRGFNGWAMTHAGIVRGLLAQGQPERAETWCLEALKHVTDEDREYVTLFLDLDLQLANAQAALGKFEPALARLEQLIARHAASEHPLALGLLHEARARIAHAAGRRDVYDQSTRETERWFRPTNTPQLIAKCERLWELGRLSTGASMRPDPSDPASLELTSARGFRVSARGDLSSAEAARRSSVSAELSGVEPSGVEPSSTTSELRTETTMAALLDGLDPEANEPPSGG